MDENVGEWRSLVAHLFWEQRVAGSNPVSPTIFSNLHHRRDAGRREQRRRRFGVCWLPVHIAPLKLFENRIPRPEDLRHLLFRVDAAFIRLIRLADC